MSTLTGTILAVDFRLASRWIVVALMVLSMGLLIRIDVTREMGRSTSRRAVVIATVVTVVLAVLILYRFERLAT